MNSGLNAVPGVSEAASAAACAKRFDGPMTKVSKVNFGFRWVGPASVGEVTRAGEWFSFFSWDEAGAPLAGERRSWVAGKVEHTGYAHLVPALEPILAGSYERNTLLLPGGAGRATVDTKLLWRSLRTDGTEVARPDLVIIETKSGATPSIVDHLLWEGGVRPVKISKYGTAMAAMHDLPANKWHRTLRRYFPEYVEAPELTREESLAMAA